MRHFYTPAELFKRFYVVKNQLDALNNDIHYTIDALNAPDYFGLSEKETALKNDYAMNELAEMARIAALHYMAFGEKENKAG